MAALILTDKIFISRLDCVKWQPQARSMYFASPVTLVKALADKGLVAAEKSIVKIITASSSISSSSMKNMITLHII